MMEHGNRNWSDKQVRCPLTLVLTNSFSKDQSSVLPCSTHPHKEEWKKWNQQALKKFDIHFPVSDHSNRLFPQSRKSIPNFASECFNRQLMSVKILGGHRIYPCFQHRILHRDGCGSWFEVQKISDRCSVFIDRNLFLKYSNHHSNDQQLRI